jgi:hypothetical protein
MTIKVECQTDDLMTLIDAAREHGAAMLILSAEHGNRVSLTAVRPSSSKNGPGRPRGPRAQAPAEPPAPPVPEG